MAYGPAKDYHISLYDHHIRYLDQLNEDNRSNAVQKAIDINIKNDEKQKQKQAIDHTVQYIAYGSVLLLISYLLKAEMQLISIIIGTSLMSYGLVGGVQYIITRTKEQLIQQSFRR